jgi:antitoxin component YwqK of YwqJK toxin-antitoxin module
MKSVHFILSKTKLDLCIFGGILLMTACKSGDSGPVVVEGKYDNGVVSRRHTEINHKKEGPMTEYYPSGKLKAEAVFKNDIQIDKATIYYESGARQEVQYFRDGKISGGDTTFFENGKPKMVLNFTDGIKDGYVRSWGEDGTLTYEAKFRMDTIVEVKGQPILRDTSNHQVVQSQKSIEEGLNKELKKK